MLEDIRKSADSIVSKYTGLPSSVDAEAWRDKFDGAIIDADGNIVYIEEL